MGSVNDGQRDRLARAVQLTARLMGEGLFAVSGGAAEHMVDLHARTCDCTDHQVRGGATCKHIMCALLKVGDPWALAALRELVPAPRRNRRAA